MSFATATLDQIFPEFIDAGCTTRRTELEGYLNEAIAMATAAGNALDDFPTYHRFFTGHFGILPNENLDEPIEQDVEQFEALKGKLKTQKKNDRNPKPNSAYVI